METIRYSREIAVEQGHRISSEINKDSYKRPIIKMLKNDICKFDIGGYKEYVHGSLKKNILTVPSNLGGHTMYFDAYIKADKNKQRLYKSWVEKGSFITTTELAELDSFRNKVVQVYVEKQHNNIYTLRNIAGVISHVVEIDLGEFYDIAGKVVVINLSKSNGIYKVNQILKAIED